MINVMPVDQQKLETELKRAGYSMQGFSNAIGRNGSYISAMVRKHKGLNKSAVMLLESVAGINYDSVKPDQKVEKANNHGFVLGGLKVENVSEPVEVKGNTDSVDKFFGVLNEVRCDILDHLTEVEIVKQETGSYGVGFTDGQNKFAEMLYTVIYEILDCINFEK